MYQGPLLYALFPPLSRVLRVCGRWFLGWLLADRARDDGGWGQILSDRSSCRCRADGRGPFFGLYEDAGRQQAQGEGESLCESADPLLAGLDDGVIRRAGPLAEL